MSHESHQYKWVISISNTGCGVPHASGGSPQLGMSATSQQAHVRSVSSASVADTLRGSVGEICDGVETDESCLIYESSQNGWVMSHIWIESKWMSHVSYMNRVKMDESCLIYESVMSHISYDETWTSRVSCAWVAWLIWMMAHMNEACLLWMSHVSFIQIRHERVVSHMDELCLAEVVHVSYDSDMSHSSKWDMNDSCLVWVSRVSYETMMSRVNEACLIRMSHISYGIYDETWTSRVSYEWVMSHMQPWCLIWMSHVSYVSHECVMSTSQTRGVPHCSSATYESVMSYMNESCLIWMSHVSYEWVMSRKKDSCLPWMRHVNVTDALGFIWHQCHSQISHVSCE